MMNGCVKYKQMETIWLNYTWGSYKWFHVILKLNKMEFMFTKIETCLYEVQCTS